MAAGKQRGQKQGWARRVVNPFRDMGSSEERPDILGAVAKSLGVRPAPPPIPNLQIPDSGIFPLRRRHQLSVASETDDKVTAWQWICEQVTEGVRDPARFQKDLVDAIGIILARLQTVLATAGYPYLRDPQRRRSMDKCL